VKDFRCRFFTKFAKQTSQERIASLSPLALYRDAIRPKRPKRELTQDRTPFEPAVSRLEAIPIQAISVP
jgi:hypothetical protein